MKKKLEKLSKNQKVETNKGNIGTKTEPVYVINHIAANVIKTDAPFVLTFD